MNNIKLINGKLYQELGIQIGSPVKIVGNSFSYTLDIYYDIGFVVDITEKLVKVRMVFKQTSTQFRGTTDLNFKLSDLKLVQEN